MLWRPRQGTEKLFVYFPLDNTKLTPESTRVFLPAIDTAKRAKVKRIYLSGHTDRSSTDV